MTDPREEIKRLADEYYKSPTFELRDERRAALHAAIDAMSLGNLTDAALEGACPVCSGDCSSANPPVLNCPMRSGPADNAGSDEPEGNSQ